jgi:hypothetical protein
MLQANLGALAPAMENLKLTEAQKRIARNKARKAGTTRVIHKQGAMDAAVRPKTSTKNAEMQRREDTDNAYVLAREQKADVVRKQYENAYGPNYKKSLAQQKEGKRLIHQEEGIQNNSMRSSISRDKINQLNIPQHWVTQGNPTWRMILTQNPVCKETTRAFLKKTAKREDMRVLAKHDLSAYHMDSSVKKMNTKLQNFYGNLTLKEYFEKIPLYSRVSIYDQTFVLKRTDCYSLAAIYEACRPDLDVTSIFKKVQAVGREDEKERFYAVTLDVREFKAL